MGVNIYFNQETHRIAKLPPTFKAFVQEISSLFKDKLPYFWNVWFVDSKGNNGAILEALEYDKLRSKEFSSSCFTIDFFIVQMKNPDPPLADLLLLEDNYNTQNPHFPPSEGYNQAGFFNTEKPISGKKDCFDLSSDCQARNETPETWDNGSLEEKRSVKNMVDYHEEDLIDFSVFGDLMEVPFLKSFSQNKWEETAQAGQVMFDYPLISEVLPRATLQPKNEGVDTEKLLKAVHLIKKLGSKTLSEGKIRRAFAKLQKIESKLTGEQLKELKQVKEQIARNFWKNQKAKKTDKLSSIEEDDEEENYGDVRRKKVLLSKSNQGEVSYIQVPQRPVEDFDFPLMQEVNKLPTFNGKPVHFNVLCNGCGVAPIVGVRYKCSCCFQFNFCEACEATNDHPHPFLKIKESTILEESIFDAIAQQQEKPVNQAFEIIQKMMNALKEKDDAKCEQYMNKLFTQFPEETKKIITSDPSWQFEKKEMILSEWKEMKQKSVDKKAKKIEVADLVKKLDAHKEEAQFGETFFPEQAFECFDFTSFPFVDFASS